MACFSGPDNRYGRTQKKSGLSSSFFCCIIGSRICPEYQLDGQVSWVLDPPSHPSWFQMSDLINKEKILFQYVFGPGVVSVWQSGVSNCRFTLYRTLIDTLTHFTLLYTDTLLYRKTLIDTLPNSLPIFLMGGRGGRGEHIYGIRCWNVNWGIWKHSLHWIGEKDFKKSFCFLSERSGTSICNVVLPKVLRSGGDK